MTRNFLFRRRHDANSIETGPSEDAAVASGESSTADGDDPPTTPALSYTEDSAGGEEEMVVRVSVPVNHPANGGDSAFVIPSGGWEPSDEAVNTRRETVLRELERVQKANFIHFLILCLVPTSLLLIVISAIMNEESDCGSAIESGGVSLVCEKEERAFVNAFTSRCLCNAVKSIVKDDSEINDEDV